jgi:hypothetical protein
MRAARWILLGAALAALAGAGCRKAWCAGRCDRMRQPPAPSLTWTIAGSDAITISEDHDHRRVRYGVQLPPTQAAPLRQVQLRFRDGLGGAKVDARGASARAEVTLLDDRRFGGDAITVDLPGVRLDSLDVVVHHHLRPAPILRDVRFGSEVRP